MGSRMSDWKATVLANLATSRAEQGKARQGRWGRYRNPVQLASSLEYLAMIDEAAKALNLNRAAFIRRSAAVVAAKVLDQPVSIFLAETPYAFPPGMQGVLGGGRAPDHDTGEGIEQFCTHGDCDGQHLRR